MKTKILFSLIVFISGWCLAQNGINYKAIVKDGGGNIVANDLIQVQFTILEGPTSVYSESHTPTTDANGLIAINIGEGTPISGTFNAIDWASDQHFLNVQINTGDGLTDLGTTQFKTVPYAITSGDAVFEKDGDDAFKAVGNIGIGTNNPADRLHIGDADNASILLQTLSNSDVSALKFENGNASGAHSFFKIESTGNFLRIAVDSDLISGSGYDEKITISTGGNINTDGSLRLGSGTSVTEFSTDETLGGNSNLAVPTERAVKSYVDNATSDVAKTIMIPATAFTGNQSVNNIVYRNFGAYTQYDAGNNSLVAPFSIPVGATVTSVTFFLRDDTNLGNVNLEVGLLRSFQAAAVPSVLFTVTTFATSFEENYNTAFTISDNYNYFIRVRPTSSWDPNLGINSVKVTYTE